MSLENPYASPKTELIDLRDPVEDSELARRFTRFVASTVDGLIAVAVGLPVMYMMGFWSYVQQGQEPPLGLTLLASLVGFLVFLLIHGSLLKANGQTVGKWPTKIRIADLDGGVPSFMTLVVRRYLPITLVSLIPMVGSYLTIVDVLFIFRGDRRCLHDLLAGTKVVMAGSRKRDTALSDDSAV